MNITDYLFFNIRKEYVASLQGDIPSDSSVIYRYFYKKEIARFSGNPYNYHPNMVSSRDAKSFRYQLMECYNSLYKKRVKEKASKKISAHKEELALVQVMLQHVDDIPKRYTDGHIYASKNDNDHGLIFFIPLIKAVLNPGKSEIEELEKEAAFSKYLKALSRIYFFRRHPST